MDHLKHNNGLCFDSLSVLLKKTSKCDFSLYEKHDPDLKSKLKDLIAEYGVCNKKYIEYCKKVMNNVHDDVHDNVYNNVYIDDLCGRCQLFIEKVNKYLMDLKSVEIKKSDGFKKEMASTIEYCNVIYTTIKSINKNMTKSKKNKMIEDKLLLDDISEWGKKVTNKLNKFHAIKKTFDKQYITDPQKIHGEIIDCVSELELFMSHGNQILTHIGQIKPIDNIGLMLFKYKKSNI